MNEQSNKTARITLFMYAQKMHKANKTMTRIKTTWKISISIKKKSRTNCQKGLKKNRNQINWKTQMIKKMREIRIKRIKMRTKTKIKMSKTNPKISNMEISSIKMTKETKTDFFHFFSILFINQIIK